MPDKVVAEKCGRTERAVRMKRFFLRIPAPKRRPHPGAKARPELLAGEDIV
jgi:hypothetical protein